MHTRHTTEPAGGAMSAADPDAVTLRVAALTDAESQRVLQFLAGLSPAEVDLAIDTVTSLQLHRGRR